MALIDAVIAEHGFQYRGFADAGGAAEGDAFAVLHREAYARHDRQHEPAA